MKKYTLNEWIMYGHVGSSSKTMWGVLSGAVKGGEYGGSLEIPYDPDDFGRCRKFVAQCGITKDQLLEIKKVLPFWGPFIDKWDEINTLFDYEKGNGWNRKTYGLIQKCVDEARIISGWIQTSPGRWEHKRGRTVKL